MNEGEELNKHLATILSFKSTERLSPLSLFILKLGKEFIEEIGENAGCFSDADRYLFLFYQLKHGIFGDLSKEQAEAAKTVLRSIEWIKEGGRFYAHPLSEMHNGDEIFWAWDFLFKSDDEIKQGDERDGESRVGKRRVILKRFADLGIDVFKPKARVKQ